MAIAAFFQGVLGASSLALGAAVGVFWRPRRSFSAAIMAFGSGTLISALAFEITPQVYRATGFSLLLGGFLLGGFLFNFLSQYIDQHGGFLRKRAPSRRYLVEHELDGQDIFAQIELVQHLPEAEKKALAGALHRTQVAAGQILCHEGEPGDYFYLIVGGEAEVRKGDKLLTLLGPGEIFGEMSLLTGEPRSATVSARTPMELYRIERDNFSQLLIRSPYLAWALSRILARRLRVSVESHVVAERNLERWRQQLMEQVELERLLREEPLTLKSLLKRSAPMAMLVGTLLDNIPESLLIGLNSGLPQFGWSFLVAVFISNLPEALSSTSGMKQAGTPTRKILFLWSGVVLLSGLFAIAGYWLRSVTSSELVALAQAVAGGAILSMLASTMMPEAYELGGSSVAYSTIAGFLLGFFLTSLEF